MIRARRRRIINLGAGIGCRNPRFGIAVSDQQTDTVKLTDSLLKFQSKKKLLTRFEQTLII
jgi:hypothetical protein